MTKTAFLFSGQGAQVPGMMKEYFESVSASRHVFNVADMVLGRSISDLCFEGSQENLNLTCNTQPCVLAADLAAFEAAKAAGYVPDAVAGFSLGEYAALVAAGCLTIEEAFPLVQLRAEAMQDAVPIGKGAMVAVMKTPLAELQEFCDSVDGYVVPANINSPVQIVASGETDAVDNLVALCKERKIRAMKIPVSIPAHCELLAFAAERLASELEHIELHDPSIPVYLNVDAMPIMDAYSLKQKMVQQLTHPVQWVGTLQNMWADGYTRFLECGPGTTLTGFVKKTLKEAEIIKF